MTAPDQPDAWRSQGLPDSTGNAGPAAAAGGYPSTPIEYPTQQYAPPPAGPPSPGSSPYGQTPPYGQSPYGQATNYAPPPYGQPPYAPPGMPGYPYPGAPAPRNGLGTAGLVLGIIAVVVFFTLSVATILGILAICFGSVGRARANRGEATNRGAATAGLVLGIVSVVLVIGLVAGGATMIGATTGG